MQIPLPGAHPCDRQLGIPAGLGRISVENAGGEQRGLGVRIVGEEGEAPAPDDVDGGSWLPVVWGPFRTCRQSALQGQTLVQPVPVHIPHGEIDIALQVVGQGAEHLDLDPLVPARCPLDGPDIGGEDAQPIQKTSHTVGTAAVTTVLIGARGAVSHQQANGSVYTEPLLATTASYYCQCSETKVECCLYWCYTLLVIGCQIGNLVEGGPQNVGIA